MVSAINTALSGMSSAVTHIAASTNNIVNSRSTSSLKDGIRKTETYMPLDVIDISQSLGGVTTQVKPVDKAPVLIPDPKHPDANEEGIVAYPDVQIDEELTKQTIASYNFQANLKVIGTASEMNGSIMDIFA